MLRRVETHAGTITLDTGEQRLAIDAPEDMKWGPKELSPVPPRGWDPPFVSASVLAYKAKRADDAIYAAVERAEQPAKQAFLAGLASAAPVPIIQAASALGSGTAAPNAAVKKVIDAFLADEKASKPIGFYSEAEDLAAIFRQDRMLMEEIERVEDVDAIARALRGDPALMRTYERARAIAARMTNPPMSGLPSVLDGSGGPVKPRVLIPSRSPEGDLVQQLFGASPIPDGFDLAEEIIRRVDARSLDLSPRADSGFYEHQLWALDALVAFERTEEAKRIEASERYRAHLRDVFRALYALTRETHAKQLPPPAAGGMPPVRIAPELVAEPVATFYRRRADAYAFLRGVLDDAFGAAWQDFAGALVTQTESLLRGAADAVGRDLGGPSSSEPERDERAFRAWAAHLERDPDLAADARMMVPVFYDVVRRQTKVWAVIGWSDRPIEASFSRPPVVRDGRAKVLFGSLHQRAAYPVAIEVYVDRILDRSEMHRLCDTHRTQAAITGALGALSAGR